MGYDAVIVGSGPNGLSAAITLARSGYSVVIFEASNVPGGGVRSKELTLPGYLHDVCSTVHPLGVGSPVFKTFPLNQFGLEWVYPEVEMAHPFDDKTTAFLSRSIEKTAYSLDKDSDFYIDWMSRLVEDWDQLDTHLLGPLKVPEHPLIMARFGYYAIQSAYSFARKYLKGKRSRGFFAGLAAHSIMDLDKTATSAIGIVLAILGHKVGWPMPKGGAQQLTNALTGYLKSLNGEIQVGHYIEDVSELPPARTVLFDLTPKQILRITGNKLPLSYRKKLKKYRYGSGVFKLDWALSEPVPFDSSICNKAGTVHIGGTFEEIHNSEKKVQKGMLPDRPFVLFVQPTRFDPIRAPEGKHTAWAYCHVPNGSTADMTDTIENQIERFAPGFKDTIIKRHKMNAMDFQNYNANYIGGDINGGMQDIRQLFTRPVMKWDPYKTGVDNWFICSSSTPPGGGVHGMCGYHAAQSALKELEL